MPESLQMLADRAAAQGDPCPVAAALMSKYSESEFPAMALSFLERCQVVGNRGAAWVEVARRCAAAGRFETAFRVLDAVARGSRFLPSPEGVKLLEMANAAGRRLERKAFRLMPEGRSRRGVWREA